MNGDVAQMAREGGAALVFDPVVTGLTGAFESYRELYAPGADVEMVGPRFYASVGARLFDGMAVFHRTLRDVSHRRDRPRIVRDGMEHYVLQVVRSGVLRVDADGVTQVLGAGASILLDMTRPHKSSAEGDLFTLSLARERLRDAGLNPAGLHGTLVPRGDDGVRRLIASLGSSDHEEPVDAMLQALRRRLTSEADLRPDHLRSRQERARRFIEENLSAPGLTPARVAAAAGLSRASLYRAFESLGGVSGWVQVRRLQRVRSLLAQTTLSISEAGQRAGFPSAGHLTVAFQARFGATPSAFRRDRPPSDARTEASAAAFALAEMEVALADSGSAPATW